MTSSTQIITGTSHFKKRTQSDEDVSEEQLALAKKSVKDEMDVFPYDENDYLKELPPMYEDRFKTSLLKHEQLLIESGESKPSGHRLTEMKIDTPPTSLPVDDNELLIYTNCLDQVKIKIEYRQRQLANLLVLKNCGVATLEEYLSQYKSLETAIKRELDAISEKSKEVYWKRKSDQQRVSKTLEVLRNEWNTFVDRNHIQMDENED